MAVVRLYHVPWRKGGNDFPALSANALLNSLNNYQYANWNSDREFTVSWVKGGYFELALRYEWIWEQNYCAFRNDSRWCFAFIDRIEWTSVDSTRFYYTIDYFSTYAPLAKINGYRTRARFEPDQKPSTIKKGDFVGASKLVLAKYDFTFSVPAMDNPVLVYVNLSDEYTVNLFANTFAYSRIPSSTVIVLRTQEERQNFAKSLLSGADGEKILNNITAVYCFPAVFPIETDTNFNLFPEYSFGAITNKFSPISLGQIKVNGNSSLILDNDNDLSVIVNMDGKENYINVSELNSISFSVKYGLSPVPYVTITPDWLTASESRSFIYTNFPQIPITVNTFNLWLQKEALTLIPKAIGTGVALSTGNPALIGGAVAGASSTIFSTIGDFRSNYTSANFSTPQSASAFQASGLPFLSLYTLGWSNGFSDGLTYYRREGFPCLKYGNISLTSSNPEDAPYDFYKCADLTVGGVPAEAQAEISSLLEKGVRVWNTAQIS